MRSPPQVFDVHRRIRGHEAVAQALIHQRGIGRHGTQEHRTSTTHNAPQTDRNTDVVGFLTTTGFLYRLKTFHKHKVCRVEFNMNMQNIVALFSLSMTDASVSRKWINHLKLLAFSFTPFQQNSLQFGTRHRDHGCPAPNCNTGDTDGFCMTANRSTTRLTN